VVKPSGEKIRVDWHGHSDRGLAIANSMAAIIAGANSVHGCAIGLGERVGNTQIDQMLVNLKLMGIAPWDKQDLTKLKEYCETVSRATGVPIPRNYPVVGDDAFRTATGVHASAIIKAYHPRLWHGPDHRHRPHERQIECAVLARAAQDPRLRRNRRPHLPARQAKRPHPD
jgi:isopropylmalate/homocitrate/citramalate synthase